MKASCLSILIIVAFSFCSWDVCEYSDRKESSINKKSSKRKSDIQLNFNLLNEHGKVSTVFNEGENFTFSLLLENNSGDTLFLDNSFLTPGNGFCAVYTRDGKLLGQPFVCIGSQVVSSDVHPFFGIQKAYKLDVPWSDPRFSWSSLYYNFKGLKQENLPKGQYYTTFKHRFCFDRNSGKPSLCLKPVNIRIDFEVI
jgi:hypothetical protein